MSSTVRIRPADPAVDLPAITGIVNAFETSPVSEEMVRAWFEGSAPGRISWWVVALEGGREAAGYCACLHEAAAPAGHFYAWLSVSPGQRGRRIGTALWEAAAAYLRGQHAALIKSEVRDDDPRSLAFARQRGFRIDRHIFESLLDLDTFDERPYLPTIAALEDQGMRLCSLADFPDTPEMRRRLFDLNAANCLDIPGAEGSPWTFPEFEQFVLKAPWFRPDGQLLVVDGDTWAGLAAVRLIPEAQSAYNLHTGVRRAYRGRKIAQALKVMAARYARQHKMRCLRTNNDSLNAPILAINRKMGYQPEPGKYILVSESI